MVGVQCSGSDFFTTDLLCWIISIHPLDAAEIVYRMNSDLRAACPQQGRDLDLEIHEPSITFPASPAHEIEEAQSEELECKLVQRLV